MSHLNAKFNVGLVRALGVYSPFKSFFGSAWIDVKPAFQT